MKTISFKLIKFNRSSKLSNKKITPNAPNAKHINLN